ncbi:asparagine synthase (glutamine-hydrolyzing) [Luteimonas sp. MC1825]|uniref:asparagine synthase (glutamine-hydrolyzing) n=1 Tax=Luteimonas sp. MC1825 TaxID=2761107 RepID=UPI00160F329E|nr:asparagine synthase (glutamine-hydrolyzing) [Luteimonas sp. MC1825]MBB6598917.1 asparagine synthase (glutamine-hydrolyzing) [Luteimonas sp. MC1825]QOC89061.1 asparagine synthase (glutamine-hydrolyzing) [Luteimonas sp. MC1825]
MCGLAGYLGSGIAAQDARAVLASMITTLAHRGPDGYGFHVDEGVGLAHARLAIIDLATGAQPMASPDARVWTVFNGEIFNFIELRARLEAQGHEFHTRSDTEVIVHLYQHHGDAFVDHLNGQFSIALWDGARRRLVLARDRLGIRPLYYTRARGALWFASEVKALFAALPGHARLDPMGLAQALTLWAPMDPDTVWHGVSTLPPGHMLAVEADGRERLHRYWDWSFPDACDTARPWRDIDQAAGELRERLVDAVRLQLRADVPVGAYLSGGLDSSGIAALVRTATSTPLRTFSVAFAQREFDESPHQQAMFRHLGTDHTTLQVAAGDIGQAFPRFIAHAETPVLRTAGVPLMRLADEVRRQGYRVVLTGEGADEVFAGYDLFKEAKVRRFWARQPHSAVRPRLLGRLYGYLATSPASSPAFAAEFFGQGMQHIDRPVFAHVPRWTTSARALRFLAPDLRAAVAGFDPLALVESRLPARVMRWAPLARDQYVEAKTLLAGYLLASQGDRAAMAASIEGRYPFLDHTLVEFANRLPPQWKLHGLSEKHVLRKALAGLLPADILRRTKQPYRAPDSDCFFVDGQPLDYVAEAFDPDAIRADGMFDAAAVSRLYAKARAGKAASFADNQAFVGILSARLLQGIHAPAGRRHEAAGIALA